MIKTKTITYTSPLSNIELEGVICWNDDIAEKRPGVLVAHAFGGLSQFEIDKAIALAELGYVGFAIDVYGKDKRTSDPETARAFMAELNADRQSLLNRMQASVKALCTHEQVDQNKLGGIGFCFGGKSVLDLARADDSLRGVVSFHGLFDKPNLEHTGSISASILALHGWDDPLATPEQTLAFANELTEREADWQLLAFGKTSHAFTNPNAKRPAEGKVYNPQSDRRAWQAMVNFFEELF